MQNRRVHRNPMKHFASIPLPQQTAVAALAITGRPHTVSATTCAARRAGQDTHLQASPPVPQSGPDPPPPRCPEPLGTAGSQGAGAPAVPGGSRNLWSPTGVPQATSPPNASGVRNARKGTRFHRRGSSKSAICRQPLCRGNLQTHVPAEFAPRLTKRRPGSRADNGCTPAPQPPPRAGTPNAFTGPRLKNGRSG